VLQLLAHPDRQKGQPVPARAEGKEPEATVSTDVGRVPWEEDGTRTHHIIPFIYTFITIYTPMYTRYIHVYTPYIHPTHN
jgi:hypothetical protein